MQVCRRTASTPATAAAACAALAAAIAIAAHVTAGFQVFTLESARRLHALQHGRDVTSLRLETVDLGHASVSQFAGRWLLVNFLYTRCETTCVALGSVYAQLQRRLAAQIGAGKVQLLSVSFDPEHDAPDQLAAYRNRHVRSPAGWTLGRPATKDMQAWLDRFGVVVIPDDRGGFEHNAAIHVVSPEGQLRAILDWDDVEAAARWIEHASS